MTAPTQAPSKDVITAPENPTLDDLIAFYGDSNFRSGVTVRVPYGATQRALEELRRLRAPRTCEWCDQGIPKSKDGRRHESQYGVWACSAGEPHPATKDQLKRYRFTKSGMFPMEDGQWVSWSDHRAEIEQYREWVEPQLERLGRVTADEPYSGHEPSPAPMKMHVDYEWQKQRLERGGPAEECAAGGPSQPATTGCIWEDCDQEAIYCAGHAREFAAPAPPPGRDAEDAERWRALIGCARITALGCAGLEKPQPNHYAHLTVNLWTVHPYGDDRACARDWLQKFADIAVLAKRASSETKGGEQS